MQYSCTFVSSTGPKVMMKYCHHFVFIFVVSSVIICVSYFSHLIIFLTLTKIGRNVTWTVIIIYFCTKIFKSFWKCNMAARPIMFSKIYIIFFFFFKSTSQKPCVMEFLYCRNIPHMTL